MGLSSKQVSGDIHYWPSQVYLEIPKPERQQEKQNAKLLKCPRCDSTNTKFCYYNNYNRSQPRHFCRACRRHWTEGGTLRNVPIGGCRKNKRRKVTPTSTSSAGAGAGNHPASSIATAPDFGEIEVAIFPEILRQVQLHSLPPPQQESPIVDATDGLFGAPLPYTSLTFLEDFGAGSSGFVWSGGSIPFTTEASSCSSTSAYTCSGQDIVGGCEDGLLGMMGASTASTWVNEEPVLPASYWDFWDGAVDFTEAYVGQTVIPQ